MWSGASLDERRLGPSPGCGRPSQCEDYRKRLVANEASAFAEGRRLALRVLIAGVMIKGVKGDGVVLGSQALEPPLDERAEEGSRRAASMRW
jgi:hypothetical protein